ncbi:MAG TPA: filamentous hemagglutinin N-terminal domain-containing protein, partial [Solimonas sp.]|nr:filamentous hemagglutinin N-terminal domain-containing protein [Solimonas sp.]
MNSRRNGKAAVPTSPDLSLSDSGRFRRSVWLAMGVSLVSSAVPTAARAAGFGTPGWFAQNQASSMTVQPVTAAPTAPALPGGAVTTPQQALARTTNSMANLLRAADAITRAQAAQSAARQLALDTASNIPDGLAAGGLQAAANAARDAANPGGCAPTNSCSWLNASLPTQAVADGRSTVTVRQTDHKAILSWDSFNVGRNTTLHFDQRAGTQQDGSNDWVALNRITPGSEPSRILGQVKAEGSVYLINQNGFVFGGGSEVNVHSLLASSLPLYLPASASTLTPGSDPAYLQASNKLFLESGLDSVGPGTASGNILGIGSGRTLALSQLQGLPGDVRIEAGATIKTGELGYALIAAPNVENHGMLSATDGQVILAAGVGVSLRSPAAGSRLMQPVLTGRINDDANGNADATPRSHLVNRGLVFSRRGDVRLLGLEIEQDGVVASTTSVSRPGSILMQAQDEQATDSAQSRTGSLRLGSGSVTAILPDNNKETTTSTPAATQLFQPGSVRLNGGSVTLEGGALVEAPGQNVSIAAIGENDALVRSGLLPGAIVGRVFLADGAIIDVAGLADVQLEMAANLVTIPRLGQNELADSPLQRDGPLFGLPLSIDARRSGTRADGSTWIGTPLANIGGYVDQVARPIERLLQNGGNISLSGAEVISQGGSSLNLDGGYLHYLGGVIQTTRLVAANGSIIDIGSAEPGVHYLGIAGRFVHREGRWNSTSIYSDPLLGSGAGGYESDYIHGGNAGALNVYGHDAVILDGQVSAHALAGRQQVGAAKLPGGGRFFTGAGNGLASLAFPDAASISSGPSYLLTSQATRLDDLAADFQAGTLLPESDGPSDDRSDLRYWRHVPTSLLEEAGFASVTVAADDAVQTNQGGEVVVAEDAALTVQPGGSIVLTGARVGIEGDLRAPAGSIRITSTGNTTVVGTTLRPTAEQAPLRGDIRVAAGSVLSAAGRWVNDTGMTADELSGSAFVNGGSISLQSLQRSAESESGVFDITGSILLGAGSLLDVSSGGRVLPTGRIARQNGIVQGRGGNISLLSYAVAGDAQFGSNEQLALPGSMPQGGRLELGGELRGYGFSGGGTLALRALGLQIGGNSATAGPGSLVLPEEFFTGQGFGAYVISAEYDASIVDGAILRPLQHNLQADETALLQAATGTELFAPGADYVTIGLLDDFHRQATNLSIFAGDYLNWRTPDFDIPDYSASGISGTLRLGQGAAILADHRASVVLGSNAQLTVEGSITAHGGSIVLTGDTGNGGYSQVPGLIVNGNAFASGSESVWVGAGALLDVSGVALVNPLQAPALSGENVKVPRNGTLLGGGSVTLTNDSGYVIVQDGALIDVDGAADRFELPSANVAVGVTPQDVWSDAGQLTLGAGAGLFFNGRISANGGSELARGGTLKVTPLKPSLGTSSGFTGATRLVIRPHPGPLPIGAQQPGSIVEPGLDRPSGELVFGADRLKDSGLDNLNLGTDPLLGGATAPLPINFSSGVSLATRRSITANATAFIGPRSAGAQTVSFDAPYVALHGYAPNGVYPDAPTPPRPTGNMTLAVNADLIDLGGQFALRNFASAEFVSSGDIRFLTPSRYDYFTSANDVSSAIAVLGTLLTAGDLRFEAAQIYPATDNRFAIVSTGPDATIRFDRNDNSASAQTPLSAGGSLLVDAANIVQAGVLRAPLGHIVLGVADPASEAGQALFSYPTNNRRGEPVTVELQLARTGSLRLEDGSITSVSLDGRIVPFGRTVDGQNWQYDGRGGSSTGGNGNLEAPPDKLVSLSAANVEMAAGASVDLSGGGDLQAQEWVAGTGGSRDVLAQFNTVFSSGAQPQQVPLFTDSRPVYAVIPGYAGSPAAYDPSLVNGDPLIGQAVYLSGSDGLPAGVYTLLPGRYATLPGAFRVVQDTSARDSLASQNATLADGTRHIAGQFVDGLTGARTARSTAFFVQDGDTWQQYSQYSFTGANSFFEAQAIHEGQAVPNLPVDAGHLVVAATSTLRLGAALDASAGTGGVGAQVDIAAERLQVTGDGTTAREGYVQVTA